VLFIGKVTSSVGLDIGIYQYRH